MTGAQDRIARLVDELMLVSVVVAGEGEAGLAAALEQAGASASVLAAQGDASGYDLAILLARPERAASPDVRASVTSLSAASERLLFAPVPLHGAEDAKPDGVLPELPQWFELFAEFGYQPVIEFDAGFLAPGAFLVDRAAIAAEGDLAAFADRLQSPGAPPRADGAAPPATAATPPIAAAEHAAELATLRVSLAASRAEADALAARLAELGAQYEQARHALAQAQAQTAGWERLRDWVRACVADPARDTIEHLARDLPRLNALRDPATPVSLPPATRRRPWTRIFRQRGPTPVPALLRDAALVRASPLFDAAWYAASIPELSQAPLDPVFHYLLVGAAQGADPGPWFDSAAYRASHPELAPHDVPLVHAIRSGEATEIAPG